MGQGASIAALLLAAGAKGKRFALPHSRILIHQPMGGFQGQATDVDIQAREILRLREELNRIMVRHTRQLPEKIQADTERDFYMTGDQAREYGIIDEVVIKRPIRTVRRRFRKAVSRKEKNNEGERRKLRNRPALFFLREESG
jgi:ATP-dependent Clp protease protease subunit